jgi:acetolactate synthase-1/3 small subunit
MLEMTGSSSKIEGLIQVLRESNYTILEISRTGRMAMRRGQHTSRVLKALGSVPATTNVNPANKSKLTVAPSETIPSEFPHPDEEEDD